MRVALVYNQKKEDATQQQVPEDATEPPSLGEDCSPALATRFLQFPSPQTLNDLYAEWDTAETIDAVAAALGQIHRVNLVEADEIGRAHV